MFKDVILRPAALFQVILSVWSLFISALLHGWKSFPKLPAADKSGEYTWWNDNYLHPVIKISSSPPGLNPSTANRTLHGCSRKLSEQGKWTGGDCLRQIEPTQSVVLCRCCNSVLFALFGNNSIINSALKKKKWKSCYHAIMVVFLSWAALESYRPMKQNVDFEASNSQQLKAFKLN